MKWHYTTQPRLNQILIYGALIPTSYEGEYPAVWFSSNQQWEPTARKRINNMSRRLTFEEMDKLLRLARIGVEKELLTLGEWMREGQVPGEFALSIMLGGIELGGDPKEWFASSAQVPRSDWRSVQVWRGDKWTNLEDL